jgi:ferritin heavy chain
MAMSVRSISTFSISNKQGGDGGANISSSSLLFNSSKLGSSTLSFNQQGKRRNLAVSVSASNEPLLTGVVFHPFEEVKKEALVLPVSPQQSLARQGYSDHCESAINEQIK